MILDLCVYIHTVLLQHICDQGLNIGQDGGSSLTYVWSSTEVILLVESQQTRIPNCGNTMAENDKLKTTEGKYVGIR